MKEALRIGLIGFGRMGQDHARILRSLPGVRVVIVVEIDEHNLNKARLLFAAQDVAYFSSLESDALSTQVDGWIVSSSTSTHISITRALLANGSRVLLEKPIAPSRYEALQLEELVSPDSSNLMMGHILLWSDEFESMRKSIGVGPKQIAAKRQRSVSHRTDYPGESPFLLLMVHDLYCIQVLTFGEEPCAIVGTSLSHSDGGEDCGIAEITWSDGSQARVEANYYVPHGEWVDDVITVIGNGWDAMATYSGDFDQALRAELIHFMNLLSGEAEVPPGARYIDAVQVQGWVDALIDSARQKNVKGE